MPDNHEVFANPPPPPGMDGPSKADGQDAHPLTNDDFRKLLMTPRPGQSHNPQPPIKAEKLSVRSDKVSSRSENRKQKKTYYAQLKKQEESLMAELAAKYRDRAKERRDGKVEEAPNAELDSLGATAGYKAVAPDMKSGFDAAERRRQMIQNSKYLGGDMEHTHLVKGLDFALLQKVRSEITNKEDEDYELEEALKATTNKSKEENEEKPVEFRTRTAKNVYNQIFKNKVPERNDNFLPGRMAYIIELDDDFADSDIPTTLMRSKTDCPNMESQTTLTTNDIVINKLTQILSYLRSGMRNTKKIKKKDKGKQNEDDDKQRKVINDNIYDDIGEYDAGSTYSRGRDHQSKDRSKDKRHPYFDKPDDYDDRRHHSRRHSEDHHDSRSSKSHDSKWSSSSDKKRSDRHNSSDPVKTTGSKKTKGMNLGGDSYAECYPGAPETADAVEDSDDDVDYSKMDMGNKKGPVGRWDFDTQEEYSDYMSTKEALPKAAFQYGVKMADGRKTRRAGTGKKDERAELDREWQKISQIISKRKSDGGSSYSSSKKSKY